MYTIDCSWPRDSAGSLSARLATSASPMTSAMTMPNMDPASSMVNDTTLSVGSLVAIKKWKNDAIMYPAIMYGLKRKPESGHASGKTPNKTFFVQTVSFLVCVDWNGEEQLLP